MKNKISIAVVIILLALAGYYFKNKSTTTHDQSGTTTESSDSKSPSHGDPTDAGKSKSADAPTGAPQKETPACQIVKMKLAEGSKGNFRKNLLQLGSDAVVNPKSLCVKIDGTPVKFTLHQKKPNQVLIGGVRGAKAEITVRYCRDKNLCKDDCKIPRDEFMDALGASDDGDSGARWDDGKAGDNEKEVAKQMNMFKEDLKAIEAKAMANMSKWEVKDSQAACSQ